MHWFASRRRFVLHNSYIHLWAFCPKLYHIHFECFPNAFAAQNDTVCSVCLLLLPTSIFVALFQLSYYLHLDYDVWEFMNKKNPFWRKHYCSKYFAAYSLTHGSNFLYLRVFFTNVFLAIINIFILKNKFWFFWFEIFNRKCKAQNFFFFEMKIFVLDLREINITNTEKLNRSSVYVLVQ